MQPGLRAAYRRECRYDPHPLCDPKRWYAPKSAFYNILNQDGILDQDGPPIGPTGPPDIRRDMVSCNGIYVLATARLVAPSRCMRTYTYRQRDRPPALPAWRRLGPRRTSYARPFLLRWSCVSYTIPRQSALQPVVHRLSRRQSAKRIRNLLFGQLPREPNDRLAIGIRLAGAGPPAGSPRRRSTKSKYWPRSLRSGG